MSDSAPMGRRRPRKPRAVSRPPQREPRDLSLPVSALKWQAEEEDHGVRLDKFLLARLNWRSRNSIVDLIEKGEVSKQGEVVQRKAARVYQGEWVEVRVPPPQEAVRHEELGLLLEKGIVYEDEHLLAVAKPPGLVVHPVGRIRVNTMIQALHWLYRHGPRQEAGTIPRICHRLDRDTSGVIVVAKTYPVRSTLQGTFEGQHMEKVYDAVVLGRPSEEAGLLDSPIGPDEEAEITLMMTTRPDGAPSRTRFRVQERFAQASHVQFTLETGRQHQIRVHARAWGHPVLLDPLYGDGTQEWPGEGQPVISRQALHARRVVLPHPVGGEELVLEAPWPEDLAGLVGGLQAGD